MKKNIIRKYFSILFIITLVLATGAPAFASGYPDQDDNEKMWFQTNNDEDEDEDEGVLAFNIQGYVGGTLTQTTYDNLGYLVYLKDGEGEATSVGTGPNGVERIIGELGFTNRLTFVNGGLYVKVEYIVRNTTSTPKSISIATTSDTEIGDEDDAPMAIIDESTINMRDGDVAQFNVICRNAYGVTDVDTMWIGYYSEQKDKMFDNGPTTLEGTDSGLAFSWKDEPLPANGTKTFSVLYGVGSANDAPVLTLGDIPATVTPGQVLTISATVTDEENTTGTKVYYVLDNGEPVLFYTFEGAPGQFSKVLSLPTGDSFLGEHIIMFYAEDTGGALSRARNDELTANEAALDDSADTGDRSYMGFALMAAVIGMSGMAIVSRKGQKTNS
jgi:hypothetical protein